MKFSENINGQLDKLLKSKKMILIVPGVALTLIAAILLIMAVINANQSSDFPDQSQALHETKESIMGELVKTREYLTQLEGIVNDNWKEIRLDGAVADGSMITDSATLVDSAEYFAQFDAWEENIYQLSEHLSELKWLIDESKNETLNIISVIEGSNEYHYEEISSQLLHLDESLIDIQHYYQNTHEEIKQLFADVSDTADEHQQALQTSLEKMMTRMTKDTKLINLNLQTVALELQEMSQAHFDELQSRLTQQDSSLAEGFAKMKERFNSQDKAMADGFEGVQDSLSRHDEAMAEGFEGVQESFSRQDEAMTDGFEQVRERISEHDTDTKDNFADVQDRLSEQGEANESAFASVKKWLGLQDTANENAFANVEERLNKQDNVRESSFENVQDSLSAQERAINNSFNNVHEQLNQQDSFLTDNFIYIQDHMATFDTTINDKVEELSRSVASFRQEVETKFVNVENIFVTDAADVGDKLTAMDNYMRNTLFQSVSDGKKLLAATLLTKGPKVANNATFEQISDAILAIPQNFEYPNAQISYDRHRHVNRNGVQTTSVQSSSGGCYTSAVRHSHSGAASLGSGCYQGNFMGHEHTGTDMQGTGCYQGDFTGHSHTPASRPTAINARSGCYRGAYTRHEHTGSSTDGGGCYTESGRCGCTSEGRRDEYWNHLDSYVTVCSHCGHATGGGSHKDTVYGCTTDMTFSRTCGNAPLNTRPELNCNDLPANALPRALNCNNLPLNALPRALSCGMTTETILHWALGCGMLNEQIIGAHIIYPGHPDHPGN